MHKLTLGKLCDLLYCITRISLLLPKETNILMKDAHNIINLVHLDWKPMLSKERVLGKGLYQFRNTVQKALSVSLVILVLVIIEMFLWQQFLIELLDV